MKSLIKSSTFLLLLLAFLFTSSVLTSCSEDDCPQSFTAGSLGEISVNRTKIGAWQSFTLTSPYTSGQDVEYEWIQCGLYILEVENEAVSFTVRGLPAGDHTYTFSISSTGKDGKVHTQEKSIVVTVNPTDIRNNYWGETIDETWDNLSSYNTIQRIGQEIFITEIECWGVGLDYSTELSAFSGGSTVYYQNDRIVAYSFDSNDKLQRITYRSEVPNYSSDLISALNIRAGFYKQYNGYGAGYYYNYNYEENPTLTTDEKELVNLFLEGKLERDQERLLSNAIKGKGLKLYRGMETEKNRLLFLLQGEDDGKAYLYTFFTRNSDI